MLRRVLLVSFIVLVLLGGALLLTNTTEAQSPVDLDRWCREHGYERVVLNGSDAYSWQCESSDGSFHGVCVECACQEHYGSDWHAELLDFNDPGGWACVQDAQPEPTQVPPPVPTAQPGDQTNPDGQTNPDPGQQSINGVTHGGIDFHRWCHERGHANGAVLNEYNAYGWQCEDSNGTRHGISVEDACQTQFGPSYHQQMGDYNDPYAWYCQQDGQPPVQPANPEPQEPSIPDAGPAFGDNQVSDRQDAGGCQITHFSMTPSGPYEFGQHVQLEIDSTCGTVKFTVNGKNKAEIGSTSQHETWKTNETGVGAIMVCGHGRGDGGWDNGPRICYEVYVGPDWRVDQYTPTSGGSSSSGVSSGSTNESCPSSGSNLSIGQLAVVNAGTLNVRATPNTQASVQQQVYKGDVVSVISGPQCRGGYRWWEIGTDGWQGWAAEVGSQSDYYLMPNGADIGDPDDEPVSDSYSSSNPTPRPTLQPTTQAESPSQDSSSWCSAQPDAVGNFGWDGEGHLFPNPRLELRYSATTNFNDGSGTIVKPYYIYYLGEWVGPDVAMFHGWVESVQAWTVGIDTTWYLWRNASSLLQEEVLNPSNWRIDYFREDGVCFF